MSGIDVISLYQAIGQPADAAAGASPAPEDAARWSRERLVATSAWDRGSDTT
ncbi:MAG: hypothetical protein WAK86_01055 [Pseudonocardiaceae bacterium]